MSLSQDIAAIVEFASALRKRITVHSKPSANPAITVHTLKMGDRTVGRLSAGARPGADQIHTSWVDPKFRGMGLGKKLYGESLRRTPDGTLMSDPFSVSPAARRVYSSLSKSKSYAVDHIPVGHSEFRVRTKAPSPPPRSADNLASVDSGAKDYYARRDSVLKKWSARRNRRLAAEAEAVRASGDQI